MLGTDKIKQYFATGTSHYVTPSLTAEWNYNLFYPPYATFAGSDKKPINLSGTWAPTVPTTADGKYGGVTAKKFSTSNSIHGSSTITVTPVSPDTTFGAKTYKIVFYAKVLEDVEVNLTSLTYIDSSRSHSTSNTIDSVQWTKFETYVSSVPTASAYTSFKWTLDYTSTDGSKSYSVLIDMIEMYETSALEYQYGNLWPTKHPFTFGRPGESYVPSGNSKTQLPTNFRLSSTKSKVMPCSPTTYHPDLIISNDDAIYKSSIIADTNQYKYFVSDGVTNSLGAKYEKVFYVNKLVLKFNTAFSKPTFTLSLYNGDSKYTDITVASTSVPDSGVVVLYLQTNGTWSTSPWTTMPTFNNDGEITNSAPIDKIILTQTDATVNSKYSSKTNLFSKFKKLQVVEISPRLELDLTQFAVSIDVSVELDNKQNPLPISAISANNANIRLSNIPLKVSAGLLSLFSNNSSNSKLKGLFKKNVKFYLNYIIKDNVPGVEDKDKVIPGGVFYAEEWQGQDIGSTTISAFDITKQLMIKSPTDYVSVSQSPFNIISNLLNMSGFTDYDYDSLYKVTKSLNIPISTSFFFADGKKQKVFDVLKEIFEIYQIGAYINAYGVMKFLNLEDILKNTTPNMILHDSDKPDSATVPGLTIESNIIQDTYTEMVKTKIGKATIKYKIPHISKSLSTNDEQYQKPGSTNVIDKGDIINTFDQDKIVTNHYLYKSIESESQNEFYLDPASLRSQFGSFNVDHDGYVIVEGEVLSFKDKEYMFTVDPGKAGQSSKVPTAQYIVSNTSDLLEAQSTFANIAGYNTGITFYPTGKICNVQRGLFNTPVKKHIVMDTREKLMTRLYETIPNSLKIVDGGLVRMFGGKNAMAYALPLGPDGSAVNYNTFSAKFNIGYRSTNAFSNNMEAGLCITMSNKTMYVAIIGVGSKTNEKITVGKETQSANGIKPEQYLLDIQIDNTSILEAEVDITSFFKEDLINHPDKTPYEEYSRLVNLKFVRISSSEFEVYLNKKKVGLKIKSGTALDPFSTFGIYSWNASSVDFSEIYATKMVLDTPDVFYHYETKPFLNAVASNHKFFDLNYMFQVIPRAVGLIIYDAQYQLAPSLTAYPMKAEYTWLNFYQEDKKIVSKFTDIKENMLAYSDVQHTGFRGKIAVVNATNQGVWLSITSSATNTANNKFAIKTKDLVALGEEATIEKVFDESNISESIEISSNWVQSRKSAIGILNHIFKTIDGFSRDTQVSVYGNPLFEIGDVVKVNYSLKNIKNQTYFVQGVKQTFATGIQTVLTLNQIGLQPDSSGNTNIQTPAAGSSSPASAPGAPTNVSASILYGVSTITWSPPTNTGTSSIDNYRVSISPFPSGVSGPILTGSNSTSLQVPGMQTGIKYTYQVSAHNTSGWGDNSVSVSTDAVLPYNPALPQPNNVGQSGNTVSWGNTDGYSTIIRVGQTVVATVTGNSYTFTGLTPGIQSIYLTATDGTQVGPERYSNIQIF